ncbi:EAL domain-containing protein [Marinobacter sp. ATCH36]|uniref:bifunctional diguanylate cyclase/phosphodiesterase n=1 Tax=Marinobacter sp. ATCH36 TaxID=2945106 RepID=UPI0020226787|nr:EAL domain-containing protein [Marinobacter sp. ATCH36]MCL7942916.1 EAL domain-containing protein [Marinobacter sp. ATCH36]
MSDIDYLLLEAQQNIHELIAEQKPLEQILEAIADWASHMMPGSLVSIMRFNPQTDTLSLMPGRRFSDRFVESMQNFPIGDGQGTCGTAAFTRQWVITENIQKDSRWDGLHDLAEAESLRACWSMPILTSKGELLGTFATYYRAPANPTAEAQRSLARSTALVALAILRNRDAENLLSLAEWYQALLTNHPDGVYTFDLEGHFQSCNRALEDITGFSADQMLGRHFDFLIEPDDRAQTQAAFNRARSGEAIAHEMMGTHATGRLYYLQTVAFPVMIRGEVVGVYGICRDITRQKDQEAQIIYQRNHDLLTGLLNQAAFQEVLCHSLTADGGAGTLATMHLNLDGFRAINEGPGHPTGDEVLKVVASRLKNLAGPDVTLARLGSDEFRLLVPGFTDRDEVIQLAERLLAGLAEPIEVDDHKVQISASIGIACNGTQLNAPYQLQQFADLALDRAKRQGRNTWQWYSGPKVERSRHSVALRQDLHTALEEDQFEIHYQPLVDAVTGRMRSVEALVRWHHPSRGMVSPGEFIPLAEQTGQIVPLGLWILRQACTDIVDFNAQRERGLRVAVNISSLQFIRDSFLDDVRQVLKETGLPPQLLEFEVTESVLLDGAEAVIELMQTLKTMGIRVALDDFGTGFSSLSYLRDLPTHKVKLDRSFVQEVATDHRMAAIVQGVITMAHHMDMMVVAEGIETRAQQEDLAHRHCDILQGYLFARPMPLAELKKLPELLPVDHPE